MSSRKTAVWMVIVLAGVLATAALRFFSRNSWMELSPDIRSIGEFHNVETCRLEVGKAGGWCGKDCKIYGPGTVADCKPLVKVERMEQCDPIKWSAARIWVTEDFLLMLNRSRT
jgi:hypothetical protein